MGSAQTVQATAVPLRGKQKTHSLQEKKALAYAKKGLVLALISGMVWSLDGLLVTRSEGYAPFTNPEFWLLAPFFCAGAHDLCSAILATFFNWRAGRIKELGRAFLSRPGRTVVAGSLLGAALGLGGYMAALRLAGPAYVLPITSLYPAVAAVMAVFILREKISPRAWLGLGLCIIGAVIIGYTPPASQPGDMFYWGLLCAGLAALGWGAQGVCSTSGMDFIDPAVALNMYYLVSASLYALIVVPVVAFGLLPATGGLEALAQFALSRGTLFVCLAGFIGAFSYLCWYRAMNMTGVSRAMALNISYALWGIFFSSIFTDVEITRNLVAGAVVILAGMLLVIGNPGEMLDLRKGD